jgi:antitoxin component YwqK of YwqJK toxin-antitoxin module
MKSEIKYFGLMIFLIFTSCQKEMKKKEYYPSGNLKMIAGINNDSIFDGLYEEYYETGEIKVKTFYKNGLIIDTVFSFHKNGNVESKGIQKNSQQLGWWFYYDLNGKLKEKREFLLVDETPYLNQIIRYNSNGIIDYGNSSFFDILIKDTLKLGGNLGEINYYFDTLGYEKRFIRIIVENKYSESLIKQDTFVSTENKKWFGVYNYQKGLKKISGKIEDQMIFKNNTIGKKSEDEFKIRTYTKYFEKEIFVE